MLKSCLILLASALFIIVSAVEPTTYTYKTVGDLDIQADVYYTPSNSSSNSKRPTVLAIHGGAFVAGTKKDAFSSQQLNEMLSRGWIVVSINYRLVPAVFIYDIVEDVKDAYKWVRTELTEDYPINPDSVIVMGGSAGGSLAVISGYMFEPRPKAIIAFYPGLTNFTGSDIYDPSIPIDPTRVAQLDSLREPTLTEYPLFQLNDSRMSLFANVIVPGIAGWVVTTDDPYESPDRILAILRNYSAVYHVDEDYPPTYISHGLEDSTVSYDQSTDLAAQLKEHNIPYKLDLVEGAEHAYDLFNESQQIWEEHILPAFEFAAQYVEIRSEEATGDCDKDG